MVGESDGSHADIERVMEVSERFEERIGEADSPNVFENPNLISHAREYLTEVAHTVERSPARDGILTDYAVKTTSSLLPHVRRGAAREFIENARERYREATGEPEDDVYHCPECGYEWSGHNRPPPYPHCPECEEAMMRRGSPPEGIGDE